MQKEPHSHFLSLPPKISKSGEKPSLRARVWFVFLGVMIAFVVSNLIISAFTEGVIYPGVSVAGRDLSFKSRVEARKILASMQEKRKFDVKVGSKIFTADSDDLGAKYDLDKTLDLAYNAGHSNPIPLLGFFDVNSRGQLGYAYNLNQTELKKFTSNIVSSVGSDPVNANLKAVDGRVEIIPDKEGYKIDQKILTDLIQSSIADGKDKNLVLDLKPVKAALQQSQLGDSKQKAEQILSRSVVLNYEGRQFIPTKTDMGYWLKFDQVQDQKGKMHLDVSLSREQIKGYLQSVANEVDTAPVNKKVDIRNGVSSITQEGRDGKVINQDSAVDEIMNNLINNSVSINLQSQPIAFNTETNRSVSLDYGRYIEVNLSLQRLWAYQDNQAIFTTPITSGATGAGFPTVTGLFSIYAKERSRYLNGRPYGWNYNVYVDYWMPFYGGYGLHDADWRSSFGGSDYYYGGSHGCVNMPKSAAAFLYGWADIGTPVWVHN